MTTCTKCDAEVEEVDEEGLCEKCAAPQAEETDAGDTSGEAGSEPSSEPDSEPTQ